MNNTHCRRTTRANDENVHYLYLQVPIHVYTHTWCTRTHAQTQARAYAFTCIYMCVIIIVVCIIIICNVSTIYILSVKRSFESFARRSGSHPRRARVRAVQCGFKRFKKTILKKKPPPSVETNRLVLLDDNNDYYLFITRCRFRKSGHERTMRENDCRATTSRHIIQSMVRIRVYDIICI